MNSLKDGRDHYTVDATTNRVFSHISTLLVEDHPQDWIVEEFNLAGTVNVVVGEPGSKKTWVLLDKAVCIATGRDWLGHATKQTSVLIIDEESGQHRLSARMKAVLNSHDNPKLVPIYFSSLAGLDLRKTADVMAIVEQAKAVNAQYIVMDALADLAPGSDENSVKDMMPVMIALRTIAVKTQAAIDIIHHSNKGGGYRGSSVIKSSCDSMVSIASNTESPKIHLSVLKSRDATPSPFFATVVFYEDSTSIYLGCNKDKPEFTASEVAVLSYIKLKGKVSKPEIMQNSDGCSPTTARDAIYSLAKKGYIVRCDDSTTGRGNVAVYTIK